MSSRCLNHILQNCYKFRVVSGTAGIHTQSMFSFKNPPNAEIFFSPPCMNPTKKWVTVGGEFGEHSLWAHQWILGSHLNLLAQKSHHFIFLAASEWVLLKILCRCKTSWNCIKYSFDVSVFKKIYVNSGDLSVISIFLETRSSL